MSLPGILGGFETLKKHFFEIFGVKEQKEKTGKYRKMSEKIGKSKFRWRYFTEISAKISEFFFPAPI